jgi:6-phosphofructokinase 1
VARRRIAVLTSGGDAPSMNAAVRAVVRTAVAAGGQVFGVRNGYQGLMAGDVIPLDVRAVGGIITRGGTVLGTARAPKFCTVEGQQLGLEQVRKHDLDGLIVIGGDGSQAGSLALHTAGVPTVGVASTIDNDLNGVDTSLGVDTALNTALAMIDRLRDTASSHHRAFVVEVMGRHSGYLALMAGIASGAELILTPEQPVDVDMVAATLRAAQAAGKSHFIVVVAEGSPLKAVDLAEQLKGIDSGAYEVRLSVLGHVQRGGSPTAFDRLLATRSAAAAVEALLAGRNGMMAGLVNGCIDLVPFEVAIQPVDKVEPALCRLAEVLAR